VVKCVLDLIPDLSKGTVVSSGCSCTEPDFFAFESSCRSQGGVVVNGAAGSCDNTSCSGQSSAHSLPEDCVIPPATNPQVGASECICHDNEVLFDQQFPVFDAGCKAQGGTSSLTFPSGQFESCTP